MMEEEHATNVDVCLGCGSIIVKGDHCILSNSKSMSSMRVDFEKSAILHHMI